jgi:hypothetical protein
VRRRISFHPAHVTPRLVACRPALAHRPLTECIAVRGAQVCQNALSPAHRHRARRAPTLGGARRSFRCRWNPVNARAPKPGAQIERVRVEERCHWDRAVTRKRTLRRRRNLAPAQPAAFDWQFPHTRKSIHKDALSSTSGGAKKHSSYSRPSAPVLQSSVTGLTTQVRIRNKQTCWCGLGCPPAFLVYATGDFAPTSGGHGIAPGR